MNFKRGRGRSHRPCIHFTEHHFSEFWPPFFQALTNTAVAVSRKENAIVTFMDSSVAPAAVIAESPSVIVVHEARKPQPKALRGSSHIG